MNVSLLSQTGTFPNSGRVGRQVGRQVVSGRLRNVLNETYLQVMKVFFSTLKEKLTSIIVYLVLTVVANESLFSSCIWHPFIILCNWNVHYYLFSLILIDQDGLLSLRLCSIHLHLPSNSRGSEVYKWLSLLQVRFYFAVLKSYMN